MPAAGTYFFYIIIFLAVLLAVIYLIKRNPDLTFWFFLNIFFDPGGYISYHLGGKLLSRLYISDIAIVPIIFCLFAVNTKYVIIYKDQFFVNFLKVFLIFALYFFIFYGAVTPYINNDLNYILFLQKNRSFLYYIIILISVYVFTMRGLKYFYFTTLFIGFIILSAFLISLITGSNIIPIELMERYEGSEMMRITIYSWGMFSILFPVSFIIILLSRRIKSKIKYRKLLYIAGMLMVMTLLITLTRRNFIVIPGTILIIILLNSYIFRKSKVFALAKISVLLGIILLIINFTLPKYIDYIAGITQDTFLLLTKGTDTRGEREYRVSGTEDLEITKKYINDNLLLGTGYNYLYWGENDRATSSRGTLYAAAMDASQEVPIYYIFFGYGLIGFIIMIFLYSFLIRLFLRLYSTAKNKINLLTEHPYEILFTFFILYVIADKFTFSLYSLGGDFTTPNSAIFIGIGFALIKKLKNISLNSDVIFENKILTEKYLAQDITN